jgi:hypothetical protein
VPKRSPKLQMQTPDGYPLGFITPAHRTKAEHRAHELADAALRPLAHYGLPLPQLQAGQKVCLYSFWKDDRVVKDVGFVFDRIHQLTGSCVWAGGTNALFSTIAAQRCAGSAPPTKAFLPFTLQNYAMSRHYMGDDSQGEGSMGSTFAKSLTSDGVTEWAKGGNLPSYTDQDGISVTSRDEMKWSSYRNGDLQAVLKLSGAHLLGSAAVCNDVKDIRAANLNGYGVAFACNNYIGNGRVVGTGDNAYVTGYWDGRGGHQQSIHAVWDHPNDGPLYWAQNNWPGSTYPKDPAGGPVCGVWVPEAKVESALKNLDSEVYAYSHLPWFPANPDVLNFASF